MIWSPSRQGRRLPPHRSQRAELPHWAPPSGCDAQTLYLPYSLQRRSQAFGIDVDTVSWLHALRQRIQSETSDSCSVPECFTSFSHACRLAAEKQCLHRLPCTFVGGLWFSVSSVEYQSMRTTADFDFLEICANKPRWLRIYSRRANSIRGARHIQQVTQSPTIREQER